MPIPRVYRKSAENFTFNVDYFDYAAGAGYKKYYLCGGVNDSGDQNFLTTDTIVASYGNFIITGNGTDVDFDLTFNNPAVIAAAPVYISYMVEINGTDATTITPTFTIYHVASNGTTETQLGQGVGETISDGDPARHIPCCLKFDLTKHTLGVGERLRVNIVLSTNGTSATYIPIDPSGHFTQTDPIGGTIGSSLSVNLPFEIPL